MPTCNVFVWNVSVGLHPVQELCGVAGILELVELARRGGRLVAAAAAAPVLAVGRQGVLGGNAPRILG